VPEDVASRHDFLKEHFPDIVDNGFTARMELDLDRIAGGETEWVRSCAISSRLHQARRGEDEVGEEVRHHRGEDRSHLPKCGRPSSSSSAGSGASTRAPDSSARRRASRSRPAPAITPSRSRARPSRSSRSSRRDVPGLRKPLARRRGRYGPFIGCTGYPDCKYIKKTQVRTGVTCPLCGQGELVQRRGRGRSLFYGCERYPECTFTARQLPGKEARQGRCLRRRLA